MPEPIPVKNKNGLNIAINYTPMGVEVATHPEQSWVYSIFTPLLGQYDLSNPVAADWHIKWALEHGINNFWVSVAPHGNPPEIVEKGSMMTYYRDGFLKAKYKEKIGFSVFLDTQAYNPYSKHFTSADSIEKDTEMLAKYYFNDPNYKKIDGKPILYLYGTSYYLCNDCQDKKEREDLLRSQVNLVRKTAKKKWI